MSNSDSMLKSDVFQRTETDAEIISDSVYNLVIGLVLCWGFFINWLIVSYIDTASIMDINPIVFIIAYFGLCILGVYLFNRSSAPLISFIGYNLVVIPFGFILNVVISKYDPALVLEAIVITGIVTVIMMILGSIYPKFFEKISTALLLSLFAVIGIELFQIFVSHSHPGWIDWIVVLIFCGYIGYDWGRANQIPKTVDNAVDSAAAIYMDIINLFVRILSILGRRRK